MNRLRRAIRLGLATGAVALLAAGGVASAAPSPGPRIAVIREIWGPIETALLTVDPRGGDPARLVGGEESGGFLGGFAPLSWRPDGTEVAFSGLGSFFLSKANGGGAEEINATGAEQPVFAPDGKTIAFTREERRSAAIWTIDLTTFEQRRLTPSRRGLFHFASSYSPDGATLLATRIDSKLSGAAEPVAIDLASGKVTRLLRDGLQPVYSPDGKRIALLRKVGKRQLNDLFVLNVATGAVRRLTRTSPGYELWPSWDPSGERIAFARFRGRHFEWANEIVQINADGSCETDVLPEQRKTIYIGPAWQPGPGRGAGRIDC